MSDDKVSTPTFPGESGLEFFDALNSVSGGMTVITDIGKEGLNPEENQSDAMEVEASEGRVQDEDDEEIEYEVEGEVEDQVEGEIEVEEEVEEEIGDDTLSDNQSEQGTEGNETDGTGGENEDDTEDDSVDEDGIPFVQDPSENIIVRDQNGMREDLFSMLTTLIGRP
jgi:hypothetical protein